MLQALFYIWLQMPLFNGASIIFNIIAKIFKLKPVPVNTDLGIGPIIKKTQENYLKVYYELPRPIVDEDSSPSADPSTSSCY